MTTLSNSDIKGTDNIIRYIVKNELAPERGPFSFSRLDLCPLAYKFDKLDKLEGTQVNRFGTNLGSVMHKLGEYDIVMRNKLPPEEWIAPAEIAQMYVEKNSQYLDDLPWLIDHHTMFRDEFQFNKESYIASELKVGTGLDMTPMPYDGDKTWFRGVIDYLEVSSSGVAKITDFKNYPSIHSNDALNNTYSGVGAQLMGYAATIMATNESIQAIQYEVYYFRYGVTRGPTVKNDEGYHEPRIFTRDEVLAWWKHNQRKMLVFERRKEFPANPSQKKCQYCDYIHLCPWQQALDRREIVAYDTDQAKGLGSRIITLNEERARIMHSLRTYTKDHGAITLDSGTKIGPSPKKKYKVNVEKFMDACHLTDIDPWSYMTVSKTSLEKAKKKAGDHFEEFDKAVTETTSTEIKYG